LKPYCTNVAGRYIEPFAGSACLFFDLEPQSAILGDLNRELVTAMRGIRRDAYRVLECYRRLPKGKNAYYAIRSQDPYSLCDAELSARFLYLNRYCFNGLYRTNLKGDFNVPYGPPKTKAHSPEIDEELVVRASRLLANATLLNADFEETLSCAEMGDFVYIDPPYATDDVRVFSEYLPDSFGKKDLDRLYSCLKNLTRRGVRFLISYGESKEARHLLRHWQPIRVPTRRNIAGFAGHRKVAYELVATNFGEVLTNAE
jgi:DNA adenine methylase